MRVLKVIVDEVPKSCLKCNHCYDNTCEITFKRLTNIRFDSRPEWCPLVCRDDVFDFVVQIDDRIYHEEELLAGDK